MTRHTECVQRPAVGLSEDDRAKERKTRVWRGRGRCRRARRIAAAVTSSAVDAPLALSLIAPVPRCPRSPHLSLPPHPPRPLPHTRVRRPPPPRRASARSTTHSATTMLRAPFAMRPLHARPLSRVAAFPTRSPLASLAQHRASARTLVTEATTPAPPKPIRRWRTIGRYTLYVLGSSVLGVGLLTGAIFMHDAFTYHERVCNV